MAFRDHDRAARDRVRALEAELERLRESSARERREERKQREALETELREVKQDLAKARWVVRRRAAEAPEPQDVPEPSPSEPAADDLEPDPFGMEFEPQGKRIPYWLWQLVVGLLLIAIVLLITIGTVMDFP